jgi:hypothetical protein
MRDPKTDLQADRVKDAIAAAARTLRGPINAGLFKSWKFTESPLEIANRRVARHVIEAADIPPDVKALTVARLKGQPIRKRQRGDDYSVRNVIIVEAMKRICKRGFQNIEPVKIKPVKIEPSDAIELTASDILSQALAECGVTLSAATIFDISRRTPPATPAG